MNYMNNHFNGIKIQPNPLLTEKILSKLPKKKSHRWMNKYRKMYTVEIPSRQMYQMGSGFNKTIICHPDMVKEIEHAIKSQSSTTGFK